MAIDNENSKESISDFIKTIINRNLKTGQESLKLIDSLKKSGISSDEVEFMMIDLKTIASDCNKSNSYLGMYSHLNLMGTLTKKHLEDVKEYLNKQIKCKENLEEIKQRARANGYIKEEQPDGKQPDKNNKKSQTQSAPAEMQ